MPLRAIGVLKPNAITAERISFTATSWITLSMPTLVVMKYVQLTNQNAHPPDLFVRIQ
jgi:hypothetical protein